MKRKSIKYNSARALPHTSAGLYSLRLNQKSSQGLNQRSTKGLNQGLKPRV
ncbi:MAG: hypothetical protein WAV55_02490 [Clostridiaceae bacterium]